MSDNKVTLDQLDNSAINAMTSSVGDVNMLNTENKTIVGALAEIVGKKEIVNAIGEPLAETDKFTEMSSEINGLLSTFKTNMMNAGVVVESGDKFKALIDKIKGLTEGEGNKGIQFAEGTLGNLSVLSGGYQTNTNVTMNLDFIPNYIFINMNYIINNISGNPSITNMIICNMLNQTVLLSFGGSENYSFSTSITNLSSTGFTINISGSNYGKLYVSLGEYYAIGVGEEDTTLRDSLASILTEEGVSVTEEDDMASLISKVDEEFDNIKEELTEVLLSKGLDTTGEESVSDLIGRLNEPSRIYLYKEGDECTDLTGGWGNPSTSYMSTNVYTKNSDHIYCNFGCTSVPASTWASYKFTTNSAVDLIGCKSVHIDFEQVACNREFDSIIDQSYMAMGGVSVRVFGQNGRRTISFNVASLTSSVFTVQLWAGNTNAGAIKIYNVWMEKW